MQIVPYPQFNLQMSLIVLYVRVYLKKISGNSRLRAFSHSAGNVVISLIQFFPVLCATCANCAEETSWPNSRKADLVRLHSDDIYLPYYLSFENRILSRLQYVLGGAFNRPMRSLMNRLGGFLLSEKKKHLFLQPHMSFRGGPRFAKPLQDT